MNVKEVNIEEIVNVNAKIPEFDSCEHWYFEKSVF